MKKIIIGLFLGILAWGSEIKIIQTFEADFTQKLIAQDNSEIVYQGKIFAQSPDNVLWQYQKPIPKEVYIHSNEVIIYEPKLQQAIFSSLQEKLDIFALVNKAKKIKDNLYQAEVLEQKYNLIINEGILEKITFIDALENKVIIQFDKIQINKPLKKELFVFEPKEGIDLIYH